MSGTTEQQKPAASKKPQQQRAIALPRGKLGIPGAHYELLMSSSPQPPRDPLQDTYRVVLTLSRGSVERTNLSFERGIAGDSYIQIAKPKAERSPTDTDHLALFCQRKIQGAVHRLEVTGVPNDEGRLSKLQVEVPAGSFRDAAVIGLSATSPFLSLISFEHDIPVHVFQMDITQKSTGATMMSYVAPYAESTPAPRAGRTSNYVQALNALYREGLNSSSPNYQFLCWFKILEGSDWRRNQDFATLSPEQKRAEFRISEVVPNSLDEKRSVLEEVFPCYPLIEGNDPWDGIFIKEVLGWKFNRVRQEKFEPLRNKIAHMLTESGGDLSISPDAGEHIREVTSWLSLLRFMARVRILNELYRLPAEPTTMSVPEGITNIEEMRRHILGR